MSHVTSNSAWLEEEHDREKGLYLISQLQNACLWQEWQGSGRMVHPLNEPVSSYLGQSISQQMDRTIKPVTVLQQNTS